MELKLPPAGTPDYTWAEYRREVETGTYPGPDGSFCRTFMEAMDEEITARTGSSPAYHATTVKAVANASMEALDILTGHERGKSGPQYGHMKDLCDRMNRLFDSCREKINERMVDFLQENDGVIDRWPSADDVRGLSVDHQQNGFDAPEIEFYFSYFSEPYKPAGYQVYRDPLARQWKKPYYFGHTPELNEAYDRKKALQQKAAAQKSCRGLWGGIKYFLALQPLLLTVTFVIVSLIAFFTDQNPTVMVNDWLDALTVVPSFLLVIPRWILSILAVISELLRLNNVLFWIGTVVITFLAGLFGLFAAGHPSVLPVKKRDYLKTLAELREATDEYNAAHDEWKAVTEAWNRAYFEHRL